MHNGKILLKQKYKKIFKGIKPLPERVQGQIPEREKNEKAKKDQRSEECAGACAI